MDRRKPQFEIVSSNGVLVKNKKKKNTTNTVYISIFKIGLIALLFFMACTFIKDKTALNKKENNIYLSGELEEVNTQKAIVSSEEDNIAATVNVLAYLSKGTYTSSGVILGISKDNQLVILTAKHAVSYDQNFYLEVKFVDGNTYLVDNIYESNYDDFAFITIDTNKLSTNTLNVIKNAKYDNSIEYEYNDEVYAIGLHSSEGLLFYSGKIITPNINNTLGKLDSSLYELQTNFSVIQGTSGGGVYNKDGILLGICSSGTDEYTRFIPIYEILEIYKKTFS